MKSPMVVVRDPSSAEAAVLERAREVGVVLDYEFVRQAPEREVEAAAVHLAAALAGLTHIAKRYGIDPASGSLARPAGQSAWTSSTVGTSTGATNA